MDRHIVCNVDAKKRGDFPDAGGTFDAYRYGMPINAKAGTIVRKRAVAARAVDESPHTTEDS
ncbi:hypothetical protein [Caballeronia sp. Lep1P3]|uniref:hypothetical protein n=1 Tax=Caballeronia sp. Lep1P3 TaxID=2878150 RepID=UPI001FD4E5A4|nr:hypothetical protein [Caballeronia sp. Lep1P3]